MILTKEQILSAQDLKTEIVFIPEWGGDVIVRGLSGTDRDAYESAIITVRGKDTQMNWVNARAKLVALAIVDEEGKQIFSDTDVKALGQKSAAAINRVFEVAQRLSGLSAQDVEELTKN